MFSNKNPEKGILALFDTPDKILVAVKKVRSTLFIQKMEAFTPFPVHGMEAALGLKRSFIPWLTLLFAVMGGGLGFLFQVWTSAVSWPINVGGKPFVSWPAFIPVTFEMTILIGGVLTVLSLFVILRLPNRTHPPLDLRLTNDLFGLYIDAKDPHFEETELTLILRDCDAREIKNL